MDDLISGNELEVYRIPSGSCLIIINRKEFEKDAHILQEVFERVNFVVNIQTCSNSKEILEALENVGNDESKNAEECKALVVIVLSWKKGDVFCGAEENLTFDKLVKPLNNANCHPLRKKPKIFFLHTCIEENENLTEEDAISLRTSLFRKRFFPKLPDTSDVLISISAEEISIADNQGSPYVKCLAEVLDKCSGNTDILSMLLLVERELQKSEAKQKCLENLRAYPSLILLGWYKKIFLVPTCQKTDTCISWPIEFAPLDVYEIGTSPKGSCLIINNEVFEHHSSRPGSDSDERRLVEFFELAKFKVTVQKNQTKKGMVEALKQVAEDREFNRKSSVAVVVVLSHGVKDFVCGTDYEDGTTSGLTIEELVEPLKRCPELVGKPKVFFVQACKGARTSLIVEDSPKCPVVGSPVPLSDTSDILLSFSSQPGFTSVRHKTEGTPYINHLVNFLHKHSNHIDLLDILLMVEKAMLCTVLDDGTLCLSTSVELRGWSKKIIFRSDSQDEFDKTKQEPQTPTIAEESKHTLWVIGGGTEEPEALSEDGTRWIRMNKSPSFCVFGNSSKRLVKFPEEMIPQEPKRRGVNLKGKFYATPESKDEVSNKLDVYDFSLKTWESLPCQMEVSRRGHAIAACNNNIWVFGGHNGSACLKSVERFCPEDGSWERRKDMPTARANLSVAYFKGKFYATGGSGNAGDVLNVVEIYDPVGDKWEEEPGPPLLSARTGHYAVVLRRRKHTQSR